MKDPDEQRGDRAGVLETVASRRGAALTVNILRNSELTKSNQEELFKMEMEFPLRGKIKYGAGIGKAD